MVAEIDIKEAASMLSASDVAFIDVREQDELAGGAVPGYVHIPLSRIEEYNGKLPAVETIIVYCRSGKRSIKACEIFASWGVKSRLLSLQGGYLAFSEES